MVVPDLGSGSVAVDLTESVSSTRPGCVSCLRHATGSAPSLLLTETGPVRRLLEQAGVLDLFKVVDRLDDE